MPYELSFTAPLTVPDVEIYINDCCWGGDVLRDRLHPIVATIYQQIDTDQEDWGWYLWFLDGTNQLAIDICCDDIAECKFRIRLTSRHKRSFFGSTIVDTPELEKLRDIVSHEVARWDEALAVEWIGNLPTLLQTKPTRYYGDHEYFYVIFWPNA